MSATFPSPQSSTPASDEWLAAEIIDTRSAAALLRVHVATLQELARRGEVPCRKVGKDYRFLRQALLIWLQGRSPQRTSGRLA